MANQYPFGLGGMSPQEYDQASERGRLMAVEALIANPAKRVEVEGKFTLPYCQRRYPEVYAQLAGEGGIE